ncbi:hypothetical protein HK101_004478 [Irineochytrium annulatum]|nr:hypothetical protein HK101_004478 [Irineochytrium annulatum]
MKTPVARKDEAFNHQYGDVSLPDPYHWMKDRTEGAKKGKEITANLKEENEYYKATFANPNSKLIDTIYKEFVSRLKEDDSEPPFSRDGVYHYYTRTIKGQEYPLYCRKKGSMDAAEEIYLNINKFKDEYLDLGDVEVSPDHQTLVYSLDKAGDEVYDVYIKDLVTGKTKPKPIVKKMGGDLEWDAKGKNIFYNILDSTHRSCGIKRHVIGTDGKNDTLIYDEPDEIYDVGLGKTASERFIFISSSSTLTDEISYIDADDPDAGLKLFCPREKGHKYDVTHQGDRFLILTDSDGALNFKLMECSLTDTSRSGWKEVMPYDPLRHLVDVVAFADHIALIERSDGLQRLRLISNAEGGSGKLLEFDEPVYVVDTTSDDTQSYKRNVLRYTYESLVTPESLWSLDLTTGEKKLLKQDEVLGGYDPKLYTQKLIHCPIPESTKVPARFDTPVPDLIPITLLYRTDKFKGDGTNAAVLDGYGSYGICNSPGFDLRRFSYCDRGIVCAIAHIRGGGENGRAWYETGKLMDKRNTFTDFIASAEFIVKEKFTRADRLAIEGASAGGLLIGAVLNMKPDICHVAIASVPFVDVINTMMDPSIPLTTSEYEEWGHPADQKFFDYMLSYSPYDNVKKGAKFPNLFVKAGVADPRVAYWEPQKWVAKLRDYKVNGEEGDPNRRTLLFECKMGSGHFGASGRYGHLKEVAKDYAHIVVRPGTYSYITRCLIVAERAARDSPIKSRLGHPAPLPHCLLQPSVEDRNERPLVILQLAISSPPRIAIEL